MSKEILVVEITTRCKECQLFDVDIEKCFASDRVVSEQEIYEHKSSWCPLKPINPNLIKALRCLASQDSYGNCYVNTYNLNRGDKPEMSCKGILSTIPCPYSQNEYNTDMGSDECGKWLGELADMLEGKDGKE